MGTKQSTDSPFDPSIEGMFIAVYDDLRRLAGKYMNGERGYRTIQPTALVHESYLRLARDRNLDLAGRTHLFAVAATQMRRILVEHARARMRLKRGGPQRPVVLSEVTFATDPQPVDVIALDRLLSELHRRSERQGRVAEMRLFSGMQVDEIASVLKVSPRTVKSDWAVARAWLTAKLKRYSPDG